MTRGRLIRGYKTGRIHSQNWHYWDLRYLIIIFCLPLLKLMVGVSEWVSDCCLMPTQQFLMRSWWLVVGNLSHLLHRCQLSHVKIIYTVFCIKYNLTTIFNPLKSVDLAEICKSFQNFDGILKNLLHIYYKIMC